MNLDAPKSNILEKVCLFFLGLVAFSTETSVSIGGASFLLFTLSGIALLAKRGYWREIKLSLSSFFLLLVIATLILGVLVNFSEMKDPMRSFSKIRYLVFGFISVYTLRSLALHFLDERKVKKVLYALFAAVFLATFYSFLVSYITHYDFIRSIPKPYDGRLHGLTGVMSYGYEMPIIMLFLWGLLLNKANVKFSLNKKLLLFICLFGTAGILLSGTKGSVVSFILGLPFLFYFKNQRLFKVFLIGSSILIFLAILGMKFYLKDDPRLKINNMSNRIRVAKIYSSVKAFKDRPIFGHGLLSWKGQYPTLSPRGIDDDPLYDTHNTYLQVLVDAGIVGMIPFMLFLFYWGKELLMRSDIIGYAGFASFIAFVVQCCFHTQFVSGVNTAMNLVMFYALSQLPRLDALKLKTATC